MKPWKTLHSELLLDTRFCKFRKERCELPDGRVMPGYYVLDFTDWVNIVPITKEGKIVLIKQYRHGNGEVTIEVPGGAVDPDEARQPSVSALRELQEETGYTSSSVEKVGEHYPNPALQSNRLHTYLAWDCELSQGQNLDPYEDITVETHSFDEAEQMIRDGRINHSLIIASIMMAIPRVREKIQKT